MQLSSTARKNAQPFLENSSLYDTDKGFMTDFLNFAADESIEKAGIDERTRQLIIIAGLVGSATLDLYKKMLPAALKVLKPEEVKEIIYQAVSYTGFSRIYPFLNFTNSYFQEHHLSEKLENSSLQSNEERRHSGQQAMVALFGPGSDQYPENGPKVLQRMREVVTDNGFGDYYHRTTISLSDRELITFCLLEAIGGVHSELVSHTKTNLKLGSSVEFMLSVVITNIPYLGYPRSWEAVHAIQEAIGAQQEF